MLNHFCFRFKFLGALFVFLFLQGCSEDSAVPQGIIVYDVSYLNLEESILENVLPSEMTIVYKGDKVRGQMRSIGGVINSEFIGNSKTKEFQQLLKSYQDYYVCNLNEQSVKVLVDKFPAVRLEATADSIDVAGYKCGITMAYPLSGEGEPMRIYHTDELDIINPNWYTQFDQISSVMLGYELEQFGMKLRLEAKEIVQRPVDDAVFTVDAQYKTVDPKEMEAVFEKLIADFNE